MQQTDAATKCNKQGRLYTTDFYRFLPLALTRASYSQTCSDTKLVAPRLRETGTPSPEIKEKPSGIQPCLTYNKSALITRIIIQRSDVTKVHISMATLCLRY